MFEEALVLRLRNAAPVAALVGEDEEARVSWIDRPQEDDLPAVTLQTISGPRAQHYAGFEGTQQPRVQIDIWSLNYLQARDLREAVIAALTPTETAGGIRFDRASVSVRETGEQTSTGFVHRQILDFRFTFSQAA